MKKLLVAVIIAAATGIRWQAQISVMDFYHVRIRTYLEEMQKLGMDAGSSNPNAFIRMQDIRNGFISYNLPAIEGYEEMAYYVPANAPKFVAVVGFGCGPLCESSMPAFYELRNGQLVDRTSHFFTPAMQEKVSKGMAVAQKKIRPTDPSAGLSQWVKLPQKGTTIQIGFMEQGGEHGTEIFHSVYELVYNRNGGTFTLVEKMK